MPFELLYIEALTKECLPKELIKPKPKQNPKLTLFLDLFLLKSLSKTTKLLELTTQAMKELIPNIWPNQLPKEALVHKPIIETKTLSLKKRCTETM
ncbi:hypothetical protein G9A89_009740 [Geosiphon pyriformis]|nr:hypothetical protein G9A89_009740 [Geosiphon pyriformis]